MKIALIIPAFNESKSIASVVREAHEAGKEQGLTMVPVVIDDCSTDTTAKVIAQLPCISLFLPINLGIGGAVQTGFKYAYEQGFDYAVQIDGDGQHPPAEIIKLLKALEEKNLDVVVGSRFIDGDGFQSSRARRMGISYFRYLIRFFTGVDVKDSTSGMRLLNRRAMAVVKEYYPDEYPEPEAILLYHREGLRIGETPVNMRERQGGTSSIKGFSPLYYMLKVSLSLFFQNLKLKKS